jgi:methyl-accepting chemotaxis protein
MKLGTKIIAGFSSLIIIAMLLGGTAIWKMSGVKTIATTLAGEYMPATGVANNVERESLQTMYEMRGYAFTEDTNMLAKASANLLIVKKYLQDAKDLANKPGNENLVFLKQAAEKAEAKAGEYEELVKQTVVVTEALEKDRGQVSAASQSLAEGASEQAASLEETSSSLEEMASMTKRNAENAQAKPTTSPSKARTAADKGVGDMQAMSRRDGSHQSFQRRHRQDHQDD